MRHHSWIVMTLMLIAAAGCQEVNSSPDVATEAESQAVRQRVAEAEKAEAESQAVRQRVAEAERAEAERAKAEAAARAEAEAAMQQGQGPHAKPGFVTKIEDGRLWVLRPGQEQEEKHITLIGAGPDRMTVKALDRKTAIEYLATRPPYMAEMDDQGIWILAPGQSKTDKPVTSPDGPAGMTLKAVDQKTLEAYKTADEK